MCTIEGSEGKAIAKGLCAKHYVRLHRAGNPNQTRKAGRKHDSTLELYRNLFREWSPRTIGRFVQAMTFLPNEKDREVAIKAATRPNGSVNVKRLLRLAAGIFVRRYEEAMCEIEKTERASDRTGPKADDR